MAKNQNECMLRDDINTYLQRKYEFLSIKGALFPKLLDICNRLHPIVSTLAFVTDVELPCEYDNGEGEVRVEIDEGGQFHYWLTFPIKYIDMSLREIYEDIEKRRKEEKKKDDELRLKHEKELYIRLRKKFGRKKCKKSR